MKRTKRLLIATVILRILSFSLTVIPAAYFVITTISKGISPGETYMLGAAGITVLILTLFNIITKAAMRSRIYIILIALSRVISNFMVVITVVGVCVIVDEIVISPLYNRYKTLYTINKEINK